MNGHCGVKGFGSKKPNYFSLQNQLLCRIDHNIPSQSESIRTHMRTHAHKTLVVSCCPAVRLISAHCALSLSPSLPFSLSLSHSSACISVVQFFSVEGFYYYCKRPLSLSWGESLFGAPVYVCVYVCALTGLEQGVLGGVFCCSWGAPVLSPNRSLVPAVVPGEGA